MRKVYFLLIAFFALFSAKAADEPTITLTTSLKAGSDFKLMTYTSSVNVPFTIDWGDGNPKTYSVDPEGWGYEKWTTGKVQGGVKSLSPVLLPYWTHRNWKLHLVLLKMSQLLRK